MSEDFLTRWSRRKRDVVETEQAKDVSGGAPGEHDACVEDAKPVEAIKPVTSPEPDLDLKSLPPIDSINAATDIRQFLAPGVPVEIARAALRRAWSADPRIRNFVGLADYDWDYHTPGSAAGFGPLEMTDELRQMVARIVGDVTDTSQKAGGPAASVEESPPLAAEARRVAAFADGMQAQPESNLDRIGSIVAGEATAFAASQHVTSRVQPAGPPIRRGHGRALPK